MFYDYNGNMIGNSFSPGDFGAIGNGIADDTTAFQQAVSKQGLILCDAGKTYRITNTIRVKSDTTIDLNGSTIYSENKHLFFNFESTDTSFTAYNGNGNICIKNGTIIGGAISFAHAENILLENVQFKNSLNDHFLEIAGCKNYKIKGCSFIGMEDLGTSVLEYINLDHCRYTNFPWMTNGSAFYDFTANSGLHISKCKFSIGAGDYAYGYNAIGVHSVTDLVDNHENITIDGCEMYGFTGCGVRLNGMSNVFVNNNRIEAVGDGVMIGDVGNCEYVVIKNNIISSSNGSKIVKTSNRYTNLTVVGNYAFGVVEEY